MPRAAAGSLAICEGRDARATFPQSCPRGGPHSGASIPPGEEGQAAGPPAPAAWSLRGRECESFVKGMVHSAIAKNRLQLQALVCICARATLIFYFAVGVSQKKKRELRRL